MTSSTSRLTSARLLKRLLGVQALVALILLIVSGAAQAAVYGSGLDHESRIVVTANQAITGTAVHGNTLYLGGDARELYYRSPGLAVFDTAAGKLETGFAELDAQPSSGNSASANKVVPDGEGGAYVVVARGSGADGVPQPDLLHVLADGSVDVGFRPEFGFTGTTGGNTEVMDLVVGGDGVLYVAGTFTEVEGEARGGLAALDAESGAPLEWAPELTGVGTNTPGVRGMALADDQLLIAGLFSAVGGSTREGLAGVSLATAAATAWAPERLTEDGVKPLTAAAAASGLLVHSGVVYLLGNKEILAVTTAGAGTVTDLALDPDENRGFNAGAIAGDSLYVTGNFSSLGGTERQGLAEVSLPSGTLTSWNPGAAGAAPGRALAIDADTVYVATPGMQGAGGPWAGATRCAAAAVSRDDGSVTAWDPRINFCSNSPLSLTVSGGHVWAAGGFTGANTQRRNGLAAVDLATDEILPWAPKMSPGSYVEDLAVSPDGATVYAVGEFSAVNGQPRLGGVALAADTSSPADTAAAVRPWDPAISGTVNSIVLAPGSGGSVERVYVGGFIFEVGGSSEYPHLVALDPSSGAPVPSWKPAPDGQVQDLELGADGTLYVAGEFTAIGGTPQPRRRLAALTAASDNPTGWNPGFDVNDFGIVYDLALDDDVLYAAGNFTGAIGGQVRPGITALSTADGTALPGWNAEADGAVGAVSMAADGTAYLIGGTPSQEAPFTHLDGQPRGGDGFGSPLGAVAADGAVTGWAPALRSFKGAEYRHFGEIREVAGKLVIPGVMQSVEEGFPTSFLLIFGEAVAPTEIYPPAVAGVTREGRTLSCEPGVYGRENYTRSYTWQRDGVDIAGATGATYLILVEDRGHDITCTEKASNVLGEASGVSDSREVIFVAPASEEPPEMFGTVRVGSQASCTPGLWSEFPTGYKYAWLLDGTPIGGAIASTYTPVDGQEGHELACRVTAFNEAGDAPAPIVTASQSIMGLSPASTAAPQIGGTAQVGQTVSCSTGSWSRNPSSYTYKWLLDGNAIGGAGSALQLAAETAGRQLSCEVVAANQWGGGTAARSAAATVAAAPVQPGPAPGPLPLPGPGPGPSPAPKPLKCKKGFVKKKVRGKARCVKKAKKEQRGGRKGG